MDVVRRELVADAMQTEERAQKIEQIESNERLFDPVASLAKHLSQRKQPERRERQSKETSFVTCAAMDDSDDDEQADFGKICEDIRK